MSARNISNHRSYRESKLLEDWEPEILTPLPLPGEYVVLQFNPVAMAKHVGNSNLIKEFKKLQTNKYVAICAGYYEAISDLKPWHMMHALLLASESEEEEELPTQDRSPDSDEETDVPPASQSGSRHVKRTKIRVVNNICVRIHTRLCDLPRTKPVEIPAEIYAEVQHRIVAGEKYRYDKHWRENGTRVPFRGFTLVQGPEPSTQENLPPAPEGTYDPAEWDTASRELQLCLLPHCDYSFNLNQETCWGSQFMDEHAKILAMLRAAIPEMPLKAVLPADYNHPDPKNYYVEERPNPTWIGMGLTQAPDFIMQKTERARRRAEQYNHRQSWFQRFFHPETMYRPTEEVADLQRQSEGIEIPSNQFLIRAPPEVADSEASLPKKRKRSWRERLADLLADLKITTSLMFWIPPAYPEPLDDEPYIPFAMWDKLSKEGKITRWESNEEYLNRIRNAQQDLVLDLTEDIGI